MHDVILKIQGATKSFGGVIAVDDLSLDVPAGKISALIGTNGSGKTTVLNLISGLLRLDHGRITYDGRSISNCRPHQVARRGIGRTFQQIRLCPQMSVLDNVLLGCDSDGDKSIVAAMLRSEKTLRKERSRVERAEKLLKRFGILQKKDAMGSDLSHGQRRLVELSRALINRPKLLLLDEPLCGLAPAIVEQMKDIIASLRDEGHTILYVEHNIRAVLEISDCISVLDRGQLIAEGTSDEIKGSERVREAYFGKRGGHA